MANKNAYFSRFPRRIYDTTGDAVYRTVTDIFRNVDLNDLMVDAYGAYNYIQIQDGERPDVLSYRLYGSASYYWTFFVVNDFLKEGINHAWPLSNSELDDFMTSEYDRFSIVEFPPIPLVDPDADTYTVVGRANTLSGLLLTEPYLTHLRLRTTSGLNATIAKYDDERLQLWVTTNGTGFVSSSTYFTLGWENPDDVPAIEALRREYVNRSWDEVFLHLDPLGRASWSELLDGMAEAGATDEEIFEKKAEFVFEGRVYRASHVWDEGRNAADGYYDTAETEITTYDALLPLVESGFTLAPPVTYWSYYDSEYKANFGRSQIKVVNSLYVEQFSEEYFKVLVDG